MRNNDEEWVDEDDLPTEPLDLGGGFPLEGPSDLATELLAVVGSLARLQVQLQEADEAEFRALLPRVEAVRAGARSLPRAPASRREPLGFRPPAPARRTAHRSKDVAGDVVAISVGFAAGPSGGVGGTWQERGPRPRGGGPFPLLGH